MKSRVAIRAISLMVACCGALTTHAATVWDESTSGDLSGNGLAPTALAFAAGSNIVLGVTGNPGNGVDRDYFSFTVPTDMVLQSIFLLGNTNVVGGASFLGIQKGSQVTVNPTNGVGRESLIEQLHYDNSMIGTNVLPTGLLLPNTVPLPAGTYSVWVQELDGTSPYGLDFNVAPVPLPGAAVFLFSGLLGLGTLRKRKLS